MLLPLLALAPVFAALVLHQHSGRYLSVAVPAVVALGAAGIFETARENGRGKLPYWIFLLVALTMARPFFNVLRQDSRARDAEAREAACWIGENASDSAWVCTYPNVELYHFIYRKPTLAWPNDYEMLLWPYLETHGVEYMVVDMDLPRLRPWLSRRWAEVAGGRGMGCCQPAPLHLRGVEKRLGKHHYLSVHRAGPPGYMEVDSLPPDNSRAIGPIEREDT